MSIRSAPKISGISDRMDVPPAFASAVLMRPTSGLAVSPLNASEPPHFSPTTRSDRGRGTRASCLQQVREFLDRSHAVGHFVVHGLRVETANTAGVEVRGIEQGLQLIVLAPQADDEYAACIGVCGERSKNLPRVHEVITQLRTAKWMRQGVDPVHPTFEPLPCNFGDALRSARDAADGAEHPDLVARADAAVAPRIAKEGSCVGRLGRRRRSRPARMCNPHAP